MSNKAKAFDLVKAAISKDVLLSYPDSSQPTEIQTDASKAQLDLAISQRGKPSYCLLQPYT